MCGSEAVCTAYAAGPANAVTSAIVPPTRASRRPRRNAATSATAATIPATRSGVRSQGRKSELRPSNVYDHQAVTTIVAPIVSAAKMFDRCFQSRLTPIPTTAPIAGARATV